MSDASRPNRPVDLAQSDVDALIVEDRTAGRSLTRRLKGRPDSPERRVKKATAVKEEPLPLTLSEIRALSKGRRAREFSEQLEKSSQGSNKGRPAARKASSKKDAPSDEPRPRANA